MNIYLVVDLGQTSDRGQPLYKGQMSGSQHVLYLEVPLYYSCTQDKTTARGTLASPNSFTSEAPHRVRYNLLHSTTPRTVHITMDTYVTTRQCSSVTASRHCNINWTLTSTLHNNLPPNHCTDVVPSCYSCDFSPTQITDCIGPTEITTHYWVLYHPKGK